LRNPTLAPERSLVNKTRHIPKYSSTFWFPQRIDNNQLFEASRSYNYGLCTKITLMPHRNIPQLICPAGSLPALKAAIDNGADAVYLGYKNDTNARNFAGLNFDDKALRDGVRYAQSKKREVLMAINTFAQPGRVADWQRAVDGAAALGVNAVILADIGLLDYASKRHPDLRLHLSVQGSATSYEAVNFAQREFGVRRAVLPRVLTLAQVENVIKNTTVEIEVFGFGSLCVMNEGRCWLSSYATGESPNTVGACSPAKYVKWEKSPGMMSTRLNGILIDRFGDNEPAGYPTLCKGRFEVNGSTYYALEEPTSLNVLEILPEIARIGVAAIKVEGRQRSPTYVAQVTKTMRAALDALAKDGERYLVKQAWQAELAKVSEGSQATLGAYSRPWR
jgi:putative protease